MKSSMLVFTIVPAMCGMLALAACQSTGSDSVEATSTRMTTLSTNVQALKAKVTSNATTLNDVVAKADSDPKTAFATFKSDTDALNDAYAGAQSRLAEVQSEATTMFADWSKRSSEITDPDLKKASEERRAALSKTIEGVTSAMKPAMEELKGYTAASKDLVTYLSQDLTAPSIKAVGSKAKTHAKDAESINKKLDDVLSSAEKAAAQFATAKPPAPAK
jgi:hypothetical protein